MWENKFDDKVLLQKIKFQFVKKLLQWPAKWVPAYSISRIHF